MLIPFFTLFVVPVVSKVTGVLIALLGLFICFLGHRFFHIGEHRRHLVMIAVARNALLDIMSTSHPVEIAVMWFVMFFFAFYCIVKAHSPAGWAELGEWVCWSVW